MKTKKQNEATIEQLKNELAYLLDQVDEDCPEECRTRHLLEAMDSARQLLQSLSVT